MACSFVVLSRNGEVLRSIPLLAETPRDSMWDEIPGGREAVSGTLVVVVAF